MYESVYRAPGTDSNERGATWCRPTEAVILPPCWEVVKMVGAAGLEPATTGLEIRCSIRLSYAPG